jgi:hypothetical protein
MPKVLYFGFLETMTCKNLVAYISTYAFCLRATTMWSIHQVHTYCLVNDADRLIWKMVKVNSRMHNLFDKSWGKQLQI